MSLFDNSPVDKEKLFKSLYFASTEKEIEIIINSYTEVFKQENWLPLGGNQNNFGIIENQQSSPIAALIEKITNSIDAILMRKCFEKGDDPKAFDAPQSMDEAISRYFPESRNWDLASHRKTQSEDIQIVADGPTRETAVIIYDNGEGQHPEEFENTFLSLIKGNKNEIKFVQGKYNMGGSGAIVFCGKKSFQLIASKRHDGKGEFGFTLIREHPLEGEELNMKKNTWYEYFTIDGIIPNFSIDELDLGLYGRHFKTGTIIKLYSYQFPSGYSGFAQELNQSINEFLFNPALPILTKDTAKRYPNNKVLELDLFGLKRRLEREQEDYIDEQFSERYEDDLFGKMEVSCYVFKTKVKDRSVKDTKKVIRDRYFKNGMSVLYSMNGQVHGHYTTEFITRSLKLNLLKNHLIIHVDCTEMIYNFRKELFMASRDRLKDSEETRALRQFLASKLGAKNSRLSLLDKRRKESIDVDSGNTQELMRNFTKNMPLNSDLMKLLSQTFKLDQWDKKPKKKSKPKKVKTVHQDNFEPQRFPSFFNLQGNPKGNTEIATIPIGGEKTLKFDTDVEGKFFDRIEEPGDLKIALLDYKKNDSDGGKASTPTEIEEVFNVNRSSPDKGEIKVNLNPKKDVAVGDMIQMKVTLESTDENRDQIFWVKIGDKQKPKQKSKKEDDDNIENLGLPDYVLVYNEKKDNGMTWDDLGGMGLEMDWDNVMQPQSYGDSLEKVFINMDSRVLFNFKSKYKNPNEEQLEIANRKYISSVYFHTLFLYTITKNRKYSMVRTIDGKEEPIEVGEYLKDLFESYYSEFILNFGGMNEMMEGLSD